MMSNVRIFIEVSNFMVRNDQERERIVPIVHCTYYAYYTYYTVISSFSGK